VPAALDEDTTARPPRRTWRDLPAAPPVGSPLPPPDASQLLAPGQPPDSPTDVVETTPAPRHRRRGWLVVVAAVVVAALAAAGMWIVTDNGTGAKTAAVKGDQAGSPAAVAKALGPAVVELDVSGGLGSGVIYDAKGLILTAHHVVAGGDDVTVKTADGTSYQGRVVGRQPEKDLAVVAVDKAANLTAARLADPGTVEVGEPVVALGSPFGFQASVTSGIVSGLDRELDVPGDGKLTGLIQTDTAINPGNSGGPLADASAAVIGINTAIASASGGSDGVGFAIPVEDAKSLIDEVASNGGVSAPTVSAPDSSSNSGGLGGLLDQIPGLNQLPGLNDLLNGLGNAANDPLQWLLDQLLNQLAPKQGQGGSGSPAPAPNQQQLQLIRFKDLPSGYSEGSTQVSTTQTSKGVAGTQTTKIDGSNGSVTVAAERSTKAKSRYDGMDGDKVSVNGTSGKQLSSGAIAWMADGDLLVIVTPAKGVPAKDVKAIAESVEVIR
jgi:putative serine protease PepD